MSKKPVIYQTWRQEAECYAAVWNVERTRESLDFWLCRLRVLRAFFKPWSPVYLRRLQVIRRELAIRVLALEMHINRPHWGEAA